MTSPPTSEPTEAPSAAEVDRLHRVVRRAVEDGVLAGDQAREVLRRFSAAGPDAAEAGRRGRLAEVAGYAGGALVLCAGVLFLGTEWADLGRGARAGFLLGAAALLAVSGAAVLVTAGRPRAQVADDRDSVRRRLVSTTWALGAAALAGGAGVLADQPTPVLGAGVGLLAAGIAYALVPGAPGHAAAAAAALALTGTAVDRVADAPGAGVYALVYVGVGAAWAGLAASRVLRERDLGFGVGAATALVGAQLPVLWDEARGLAYALTALVAVAGYAGYLLVRRWPVLAAGVLATTLVVPEALLDWTDGSVSVAGALLVAGATLLAASAAGLRLRAASR